jgi:hypothetical protein
MSFNTTSYFAGVVTVFTAVTLGFAGGYVMSNATHKPEPPNRIERLAANARPANPPGDQAATTAPQPAPAPQDAAAQGSAAQASAAAPAPAPQAVAQQQPSPQPVAQQQPPAQEQSSAQPSSLQAAAPAPTAAKDDSAELAKIHEADLKAAERKRAHRRWAERQRHQQELDAATAQVRQNDRDDGEEVVQRAPVQMPRFGLFDNNDD